MTDATTQPAKTPWHLWVVGVISLLWNAMGALDFTLTQLHNEAYLKACTTEQKAFFFGLPGWLVLIWGVATWGCLLGSVALLLRKKFAATLFLVACVCMVATHVYSYGVAGGLKVMGQSATSVLILTGVIWLIAFLLLFYARCMAKRGVLR